MEASAPPHDFALIPTDFRNIVLSGTRQAFESCGARRSLETCARIVRFVDPFLSQGRLIRSFLFFGDSRFMRIGYGSTGSVTRRLVHNCSIKPRPTQDRRGGHVFCFREIQFATITQNIFLRDDFLTIDLVSRVDRNRSWVPPGQRAREINPVPSCPSLRRDTSCSPPEKCQGSDP